MTRLFLIAIVALFISGCQSEKWAPSSSIILDDITPIGFGVLDNQIWISDGDNNRVVVTDMNGTEIQSFEVQRPMHLDISGSSVFVPSYGSDQIYELIDGSKDSIPLDIELEAPAAVAIDGSDIAIADFYNHRIVLKSNNEWTAFGTNGKDDGEFNYPTDVQFLGDRIFVADAYNNRIQIFTRTGEHLSTIGKDQKMNAATGIFVDEQHIMATDFENDRVLIFDHSGKVEQILDQGLNKPTDLLLHNGMLMVGNYRGKYISIYTIE